MIDCIDRGFVKDLLLYPTPNSYIESTILCKWPLHTDDVINSFVMAFIEVKFNNKT